MASIHRNENGGANWFCAFYDPEGFRRFRSTGTTNAKVARTICVNIEQAADLARQGKLSNEKALRLIRQACDAIGETHGKLAADRAGAVLKLSAEEFIKTAGGELTTYTVKTWFEAFIANRTDASKATITEYTRIKDLFLKFLGARGGRPLTVLQPKQIEDFKAQLLTRVSPSTVNKAVKILKACFNNAIAKRQLDFNPAEHVSRIEEADSTRRPFTDDELKNILKACDAKEENKPWRTMVLLAYYTGLRLQDCANLTWERVQLHTGTINLKTQKTGRRQDLPIAEPLAKHLAKIAGDNPTAPLCPSLFGQKPAWLSAQFYKVMTDAKVVQARGHESTGKGRDGRRDTSKISFHSLRYNTTSALKSRGVSDSVAMDIVGHETASISRNYTKIDDTAKRAAISKLPDITL